jgi:hypothetical protein
MKTCNLFIDVFITPQCKRRLLLEAVGRMNHQLQSKQAELEQRLELLAASAPAEDVDDEDDDVRPPSTLLLLLAANS